VYHHKRPQLIIAVLVIASMLLGTSGAAFAAVPVPETIQELLDRGTSPSMQLAPAAAPASPVDESQVPHYFGPNPNWALSPFTVASVTVDIVENAGGTGSGAAATATVDANGTVTGITLTSPGSGYTAATPPQVQITGAGSGASANATVAASGSVTSIAVNTPGSGYTAPTVTIGGGGGSGTLVNVGNQLIARTYATDYATAPGVLAPVFVIVPTTMPANGTVQSIEYFNQATTGSSPNNSAGNLFHAYILHPTGVANQYTVLWDSGVQTVPTTADPVGVVETIAVPNVAVTTGDVIAFYGQGIPLDDAGGADILSYPAPSAPSQGSLITVAAGDPNYPVLSTTRTYSFGATVRDASGAVPLTAATATAYGSVDKAAFEASLVPGFGYTMPTIDFDMPDGPNGVQAKAHVASTALGDPVDGLDPTTGQITAIVLDEPGSGYSKAPNVVIRDGTLQDPLIGGSGASATATLNITSIVVDTPGDGYVSAPTVAIIDSTGSGASATATVSAGAITAINLTAGGSGYITGGGIKKFVDPLPGLCVPGANCPDWAANPAAKAIPLALSTQKTYNGITADEYQIGLVQYRSRFSSSLPASLVRGYVQIAGPAPCAAGTYELFNENVNPAIAAATTGYCGVTPPQYLGPVIAATKDKPVRIIFRNLLPKDAGGDLILPADSTLMGSGMAGIPMYDPADNSSVTDEARNPVCSQAGDAGSAQCFKENRATLHLHGGITPWISDGTPHQWITPANENTAWPQGVSVSNVPDMAAAGCDGTTDGCMTFYYTNQQSARLLFYHDHAWGITRLNVYAGEAAGYLITDDTEKKLINTGTIPGPADTIPLIIQDKTFVPQDEVMYNQYNADGTVKSYGLDPTWDASRWGGYGNFWFHHVYMPAQNPGDPSGMSAYGRWMYGPWFWPPAAATKFGPIPNPYYNMDPATGFTTPLAVPCNLDDPATWQYDTDPFCEPALIPGTPNISTGMEQFNDTPIVNGVAYPTITLQPKTYRLRILNAANDRFMNYQWYIGDPTTASTGLNSQGQAIGATEVALNPAELAAAQTDPVVFPTPVQGVATAGPDWIQIGTEGGFLPAPVVVDGQQPTTWITDPTRFDVGNVDKHSLLLAPAERADVIVDFSKFAGKTLILYNDAPAAFPARVPSYDYYTGAPDLSPNGAPAILPGYGPNTRTIMQVKIAAATPAPAFNLTALRTAFNHKADGSGVFESGQHPIIVGQAAYNSAYGTSFAASSNCNVPPNTTTTTVSRCDGLVRINDTSLFGFNTLKAPAARMLMPLQPKAIHDEMNSTSFDEFGRMQAFLGVEAQPPTPGLQNVTLYPYVNPQTELIDATNLPKNDVVYDSVTGLPVSDVKITPISSATDGTQLWRITHNGVDTHPVHFHLYDVQVLNRVTWDNIIIATEANELGWKDTIRVSPLEDTIVALRPVIPELPWELPNAVRNLSPMMATGSTQFFNNIDPQGNPTAAIANQLVNFGWEYVYHCHILTHEEMDMMRPVSVAVPPVTPDGLAFDRNTKTLSWNDRSIAETAYVVQRSTDGGATWAAAGTVQVPLDPNPATPQIEPNTTGPMSFVDTGYDPYTDSQFRVVAQNTVGYRDDQLNVPPNGFQEMTAQSMSAVQAVPGLPRAPSNLTAAYAAGPAVSLAWTDNAINETGFTIQRATNAAFTTGLTQFTVGANVTTYLNTGVTLGATYYYRVMATNSQGNSPWSNTASITLIAPPVAPSNLTATLQTPQNRAQLAWRDNSTDENLFQVWRSVNGGAFTLIGTVNRNNQQRASTGATVNFTDNNLAVGNTYAYYIIAVNTVPNPDLASAPSNTASVALTVPAAPANLAGTAVRIAGNNFQDRVTLTWTDNATNETGFQIQRATNANFTGATTFTVGANTTTLVQNVGRPVTYYYRILATGQFGNSAWSNVLTLTAP
jgi:FtsP/CotA-like multicopper oxidase with cupredoxin domain